MFAIGIILFIMYSGLPPFTLADPENDMFYRLIATNRADLFWMAFEQNKPEGFFTPEFKDLITNMLQLDPL